MGERIPQEELDKNYRNFIRRIAGLIVLAMAEEDVSFEVLGQRLNQKPDEIRQWLMNLIECNTTEGRHAVDLFYAMGQRIRLELRKLPRAEQPDPSDDKREG